MHKAIVFNNVNILVHVLGFIYDASALIEKPVVEWDHALLLLMTFRVLFEHAYSAFPTETNSDELVKCHGKSKGEALHPFHSYLGRYSHFVKLFHWGIIQGARFPTEPKTMLGYATTNNSLEMLEYCNEIGVHCKYDEVTIPFLKTIGQSNASSLKWMLDNNGG